LITELAFQIYPIVMVCSSAWMGPVAMGRLAKEVCLAIAARGRAGAVVRQLIAVLGAKWLLEAVEGLHVAELGAGWWKNLLRRGRLRCEMRWD
jgi:hypothetical protein